MGVIDEGKRVHLSCFCRVQNNEEREDTEALRNANGERVMREKIRREMLKCYDVYVMEIQIQRRM